MMLKEELYDLVKQTLLPKNFTKSRVDCTFYICQKEITWMFARVYHKRDEFNSNPVVQWPIRFSHKFLLEHLFRSHISDGWTSYLNISSILNFTFTSNIQNLGRNKNSFFGVSFAIACVQDFMSRTAFNRHIFQVLRMRCGSISGISF